MFIFALLSEDQEILSLHPAVRIVAILWDKCSTSKTKAWSCEIQEILISSQPQQEATADKQLLNQYINVSVI